MEPAQNQAVEIATVVFFDLEATELPSVGVKPRITELCMTAVQRAELNSTVPPRVVNQLQLCFNPQKPIPPIVSNVTGLYNDTLEGQAAFSGKTCQTVQAFLEHLPLPVCLVAHNGNVFDFPLLLAEFSRCQSQAPPHLLSADSLKAFKELDASRPGPDTQSTAALGQDRQDGGVGNGVEHENNHNVNERNGAEETEGSAQAQNEATPKVKRKRVAEFPSPVTKSKPGLEGDFSDKVQRRRLDFDSPPNRGKSANANQLDTSPPGTTAVHDQAGEGGQQKSAEEFRQTQEMELEGGAADSAHGDPSKGKNSPPPSDTTPAERYTLYSEKTEEYDLSFMTGRNQNTEHSGDLSCGREKQNLATPSKVSRLTSKKSLSDEDLLLAVTELEAKEGVPADIPAASVPGRHAHSKQQRHMATHIPVQRQQKVSYSQAEVYRRLFGRLPPDAHAASADTMALMKCAQKYCPGFLLWLDNNATPLDSHQPLY